jgi:hypothetical protein
MLEDQKSTSSFKVVDRRTFSEDGTVRRHPGEEETKTFEKPQPVSRQPSAPPRAVSPARPEPEPEPLLQEGDQGFETLVSFLSATAMFQLGLLPGPAGERIPMDLENAHRTIDMLEVLQNKTRGNLTHDEIRLLEDVIYELRMSFVELERRHTQKAK